MGYLVKEAINCNRQPTDWPLSHHEHQAPQFAQNWVKSNFWLLNQPEKSFSMVATRGMCFPCPGQSKTYNTIGDKKPLWNSYQYYILARNIQRTTLLSQIRTFAGRADLFFLIMFSRLHPLSKTMLSDGLDSLGGEKASGLVLLFTFVEFRDVGSQLA